MQPTTWRDAHVLYKGTKLVLEIKNNALKSVLPPLGVINISADAKKAYFGTPKADIFFPPQLTVSLPSENVRRKKIRNLW